MDRIEAALEPPRRIDPVTARPYGWGDDADVWAEFEQAVGDQKPATGP